MKEELEEIVLKLAEWCKKYDKDYVTACFIDGVVMANIRADDKDYAECNVYKALLEKVEDNNE